MACSTEVFDNWQPTHTSSLRECDLPQSHVLHFTTWAGEANPGAPSRLAAVYQGTSGAFIMNVNLGFRVINARSFADSGLLPVRPITILLGENSSGKTSFFALLYETMREFAFTSGQQNYFDLGSFEEIVHNPEGKELKQASYGVQVRFETDLTGTKFEDFESDRFLDIIEMYKEEKGKRYTNAATLSLAGTFVNFNLDGEEVVAEYKYKDAQAILRCKPSEKRPLRLDHPFLLKRLLDLVSSTLDPDNKESTLASLESEHDVDRRYASNSVGAMGGYLQHIMNNVDWKITPTTAIRSAPRRVYLPSPGSHRESSEDRTPAILNSLRQYEPQRWEQLRRGLKEFGDSSGLFNDIDVKSLRSRGSSSPFEIIVKRGGVETNIIDMGYGISQVIPFICDILLYSSEVAAPNSYQIFYVQQPETHLHPTAQAALGTFFYQLSTRPGVSVILETHSDFIVDRLRQELRRDKVDRSGDFSLLFFENIKGVSTAHSIEVDKQGNVHNAPEGYREFFVREELNNLIGLS